MDRAAKKAMVASLHEVFSNATAVVVSHNLGLTAGEATELRRQMRAAGASFKVTKNSLTKLALADTPYEHLASLFSGPTAIAVSEDPVGAAKATVEFAKGNDNLVILGGGLGENTLAEVD
ncbi:MAG: 50S ribosomal protein L10, partial [Alphaproteobacteria bacterium]|nr:50S ribosomal protein L10 [Alphaproteobacteria bacterium]